MSVPDPSSSFHLDVLTLGKVVFSGDVTYVDVPGAAGHLGVLRQHTPTLAALAPGMLRYEPVQGDPAEVKVLGGFVEIGPRGVRVLADHAGRDAVAEEHRMADARRRASVHTPGAARPNTPEALKAEMDAELLRFFINIMGGRDKGQ